MAEHIFIKEMRGTQGGLNVRDTGGRGSSETLENILKIIRKPQPTLPNVHPV